MGKCRTAAPTLCGWHQFRIVAVSADGCNSGGDDACHHPHFRSVLDPRSFGRGRQASAQDDIAKFYRGRTVNAVVGYGPGSTFELYLRMLTRHIGKHIPGNPERRPPAHAGRGLAQGHQLPRGGSAQGWLGVRDDQPGQYHRASDRPEEFPLRPAHLCLAGEPQLGDLHLRLLGQGSAHASTISRSARSWSVRPGRRRAPPSMRECSVRCVGLKFKVVPGYAHAERHPACLRARRNRRFLRTARLRAQDRLLGPVQIRPHGGGGADGARKARELAHIPNAYEFAKSEADRQLFQLIFGPWSYGRPLYAPPGTEPAKVAALRAAPWRPRSRTRPISPKPRRSTWRLQPIPPETIAKLVDQILRTPAPVVEHARQVLGVANR